jgi:hypothetical protein
VLSGTGLAEEGGETIVVVARGVVQSTIGLHDGSIKKMLIHQLLELVLNAKKQGVNSRSDRARRCKVPNRRYRSGHLINRNGKRLI